MENGFHPQRPQFDSHTPELNSLSNTLIPNSAPNPVDEEQQELRYEQHSSTDPENNANGDEAAAQQLQQNRVKRKRSSKACDACRVRKVKCDPTRIPCAQCAEHKIPCEFTAPTKKRGPPNAYIEALRQKRVAAGLSAELSLESTQPAPAPYGIFRPPNDRGLEELTSPPILNLMFDDFFQYVYPIAPIIVESAFRRVLSTAALHNNDFFALASSILGCTLACLRSSESQYGGLTVEHTYQFAIARLGVNYRDRMSLEIAATLEYLSLASAYAHPIRPLPENPRTAFLSADFTTAVQMLFSMQYKTMNFMDQQLLKRMYQYVTYVQISCDLQGVSRMTAYQKHRRLVHVAQDDLLPIDISDIDLDRVNPSGEDYDTVRRPLAKLLSPSAKSYVPGLLLLCNLYNIFADSFDIRNDKTLPPHVRYTGLCQTLHEVQHSLDEVPVQLKWEENNKVHGVGFEVQKANLFVSKMHICSVLLEQCYQISLEISGSKDAKKVKEALEDQRREIISETLKIIKTISRRALEANGFSMIKRVRQVASTLVDIIQVSNSSEKEAASARKELSEFVKILGTLDPAESMATSSNEAGERIEDSWSTFKNEQGRTSG